MQAAHNGIRIMSLQRKIVPKLNDHCVSAQDILNRCAREITTQIEQGLETNYKEVLNVSSADAHRMGLKPITFCRQVLSACFYPSLLNDESLPLDARERARSILRECSGGSIGSYSEAKGIEKIQESVCKFITKRDGVVSHTDNIFISNGSQSCLTMVLELLVQPEGSLKTGVLVPVPSYFTFNMAVADVGGVVVPYYLCEEQGWAVQREELSRALHTAREQCNPMVLYLINPGPTGHVQSKDSIAEVIRFAAEERLFLMVDEVHQDNVYGKGIEFYSYRRVLSEMGPPYSNTMELASFHSISKSVMGESALSSLDFPIVLCADVYGTIILPQEENSSKKSLKAQHCHDIHVHDDDIQVCECKLLTAAVYTLCGLRGGYVELLNLDPLVIPYLLKFFSIIPCCPLSGQIAMDVMVNPPQPTQPSYELYTQEAQSIRNTIRNNAQKTVEVLSGLPGISCQPVNGGIFAFPRLHLSQSAIKHAKDKQLEPDFLYCLYLLEDEGLCVGPGCVHGQKEETYHIRISLATPEETMKDVLQRLKNFHLSFIQEFP